MQAQANALETVIRPARGRLRLDLGELWEYRELLGYLAWRDITVRYRQTALGIAWAVVGPLSQTLIFWLVFSKAAGLPTAGLPAALYNMAGLVAWRYFANTLAVGSNSLVSNGAMLTKIYFPRLLLPLAACLTSLADLAVGFCALLVMMIAMGVWPAATTLLLPLVTLPMVVAALGASLFFAALNVRFRDVYVLVPFILQVWLYATVIFPLGTVIEEFPRWGWLWAANPLVGVVEGWRWCLMHSHPGSTLEAPWFALATGLPATLLMAAAGLWYFRRVESQFADII